MTHPIPALSRRNVAAIIFIAVAIAVSACSGNGNATSSNQELPRSPGNGSSTPTPAPIWTFLTVDNAAGGNSRITGINNATTPHAIGLNGTTHADYHSWTVHAPYTSFDLGNNYPSPNANGTYISAIADSNANYEAGTVFSPPPNSMLNCTTCGITYYGPGSGTSYGGPAGTGCGYTACMWTFIQDPSEGSGSCAVTAALGLGDSQIVVGYYETGNSNCGYQAFESHYFPSTGESFVDFNVPNAAPNTTEATAVNGLGDVTGIATFGSSTEGWFYADGLYCTGLMVPGAAYTYPLGINWSDDIVGYYQDTNTPPQVHGFMLYRPSSPTNLVWVNPIDEPNAYQSAYTVVSGASNHRTITGWYKDQSSKLHGFIATCLSDCGKSPSQSERKLGERHSIRAFIAARHRGSTAPQPTCTASPNYRRKAL